MLRRGPAADRRDDRVVDRAGRGSGTPSSPTRVFNSPLADSATELLAARLMTYHAGEACDTASRPDHRPRQDLHGEALPSERANRVADRCVQLYGGRGDMTENVANRYFRELRVDRIWEGTSEIQRVIVARGMIKARPRAVHGNFLNGV